MKKGKKEVERRLWKRIKEDNIKGLKRVKEGDDSGSKSMKKDGRSWKRMTDTEIGG